MEDSFVKEIEQEAKGAMKKKMYISVFVMLAILAVAMFVDSRTDGYPMNIQTDKGTIWSVNVADSDVLTIVSQKYSGGKYRMILEGVSEGETEIHMVRTAEEDSKEILEERTYHMKVDEKDKIIQQTVERTVY